MESTYFVIAMLAGVLPALFWLWFWLREDTAKPEPPVLVASAFLAGMAVVTLVLPLQRVALGLFEGPSLSFVWVVIEEVLKYSAALIVVLWNRSVDEPVDVIIYMISIALGFSALENALFIFTPLMEGNINESLLTGHFRFFGATLLHVLASGTVGAAMALAFYKKSHIRVLMATLGLFLAIALHALFNSFIMRSDGETVLSVFLFVWMGIIALLLVFEKAKLIRS